MRPLHSLNIRDVQHLGKILGATPQEIAKICRDPKRYYREGTRIIKGKPRPLATPYGRLREILDKLQPFLQRVVLPMHVHGGRKGHSHLGNALSHVDNSGLFSMDLKDFFPSVSHHRVYRLFYARLGCSPDVARYLTRLTTLNGCLPQGSPTSTILAAIVSEPLVKRLAGLSVHHGAVYTQYVDDIAFSGPGYVGRLVPTFKRIVQQEGYRINESKTKIADHKSEKVVTGVRINGGPDIPSKMLKEVRGLLDVMENCQGPQSFPGRELISLKGKIGYIESLNRGAGKHLRRRLSHMLSPKYSTAK